MSFHDSETLGDLLDCIRPECRQWFEWLARAIEGSGSPCLRSMVDAKAGMVLTENGQGFPIQRTELRT